ncbi:hypothetical protein [Phreatobacter sp.]|uniref:hypothetical protein n=1 Tax=Phreatobacter sp. TaxID=1966341 RepID=UPI003F6FE170
MTDHNLHAPSRSEGMLAGVRRRLLSPWRTARDGAGWRSWTVEVAILIAVVLVLAIALRPRIELLQASPHPFWIPVVAISLVHGTLPGMITALIAGICASVLGPGPATTEEDFYDLMFRTFKEPVLWLFSAMLLGAFRDRIEEERQKLARERERAQDDLAMAVEHAAALRSRIAELERSIVLARLDDRAKPAPRGIAASVDKTADDEGSRVEERGGESPARKNGPEPRVRVRSAAGDVLQFENFRRPSRWAWASLWEATSRGWELKARQGGTDLPDAGRLLHRFDRQPRLFDSRHPDDRHVMPEGARLAMPIRTGPEPPSRLIILGGDDIRDDERLEDLLHGALQLADQLSRQAEGEGR